MLTNMPRRLRLTCLVVVFGTLIAACGTDPLDRLLAKNADSQQAIEEAVQATLTAVAADAGTGQGQTALASAITPTPAAPSSEIQLPPQIPDWQSMANKPYAEKGSPDAPVVLIEYSDFQCPWCTRFYQQVLPQLTPLIEAGDVRFVYKQFPVLGAASTFAAQATECAGQQGNFWSLHDWLFDNQSAWKGQADVQAAVLEAAATLGYDREALTTCIDDPATMQVIAKDIQETRQFGFRGTPTFILNGRIVPGFLPWEKFDPLIQASKAESLGLPVAGALALVTGSSPPETDFEPEEYAVDGDPDAPVTIVEFSDYQCPFCQRFFQETKAELDQIYIKTGKVRFIYKDFPLDSIHPQARTAALAAECAGAQQAYWPMHDRIFQGTEEWADQTQAADIFKGYAVELNLNPDLFDACMDDQTYAAEIQADLEEGERAGVSGTPAFFINGQQLDGAQPLDAFVQIIEAELNR